MSLEVVVAGELQFAQITLVFAVEGFVGRDVVTATVRSSRSKT